MTLEVRQTVEFRDWLAGLRDERARVRIAQRIVRLQSGLFGDTRSFDGIGELRVDHGPDYRVCFCRGDKRTQQRDIKKAVAMAREV